MTKVMSRAISALVRCIREPECCFRSNIDTLVAVLQIGTQGYRQSRINSLRPLDEGIV